MCREAPDAEGMVRIQREVVVAGLGGHEHDQSDAERRRDQPNEVVISPTHIFDATDFSLVMQE
jgi:hypothetical protein